ncbi:stage III sporulation protein AA [Clostridium tyrobutyricum]|jgi:stage III sporulation protein AA|uniref:stage III sporulation protein AA n=1 Tax=Clostridium tyrobutyricum TaxID=1519 RepID=UPI00030B58C9|nr:stage III sporulation protein AA [Clostridium tyrobutyricum]MBV4415217.1 stage III sporulation protein AA [Clostridium tyrobutyricum]MBV4420888.1 stage III sporulation protein AA [Clostridium tyrobutyricum]MBV4423997.1 stage III sporulation protein AA [Clostridium tyrobutyricum]MBV4426874.1 stage III sporulation protein AA [Clostridium tyrobutyricum]MBV4429808.1 stage III sporulation protein AA [Clostridium tyrobutyricum]
MDTKEILNILPERLKNEIRDFITDKELQEIRIKINEPLILQVGNREIICKYVACIQDLSTIIKRMSNYSIYAFEEEMRRGYITISGGHRIGICGRCVIEKGEVKTIKDISSLNIRICREIIGCSNKIMKFIASENKIINTIIISPPKCGKTTLIRDITKNISNGIKAMDFKGKKVCIVDERSEIGACSCGVPQLNIGMRTDVLDGCLKSEGIIMAIRSMSPDVIVCDEIGSYKDMDSIVTALNSGVSLITTIHGYGVQDLENRPVFKTILENKVFRRAIVLSGRNGAGTIEYVYDFPNKKKIIGEYID